jgi:hypothetical protein
MTILVGVLKMSMREFMNINFCRGSFSQKSLPLNFFVVKVPLV